MEEQIQKLYQWSLSNNHIPSDLAYDTFAKKVGSEQGLRAYYDRLAASPVEGSQFGAAGGSWEDFSAAYLPKKKDGTASQAGSQPSGGGLQPSLSSPSAPAPSAATPSAPDGGPLTVDLTDPAAFAGIGTESRQGIGPYSRPLTGDEDPVAFGESLKATLPNYEYRKTYESKTALRKASRDMDNIARYGTLARQQSVAAEKRLDEKYGKGWQNGLENMAEMMGQMKENLSFENPNDAAQYRKIEERYNQIVSDPDFEAYNSGLKAQQKGYEAFTNYAETNPEIKKRAEQAKAAQRRADLGGKSGLPEIFSIGGLQGPGGAGNWAIRKAAQLAGGAMTLPRTIGRTVFPDDPDWEIADEIGSIGDEMVESANINYPKPEYLSRPLYEKSVKFEGKDVIVDSNGKFVEARDKDGKAIAGTSEAAEGEKSFEQRFKESGAGKDAGVKFNGTVAATLDKTVDVAADLMIYRFLGGGTKVGTMLTSMGMSHQQAYAEAIEQQKMSPADAAEYAFFSSLGVGALEAYVGNIETQFAKPAVREALALGRKEALAAAGKMTPAQRAVMSLKPVVKEIAGENAEEVLQSLWGDLNRARYNQMTGAEMEMETTKEGLAETVLLTTLVTAPAAALGMGGSVNQYRMSAIMAAVKDPARFDALMADFVGEGAISQEEAAGLSKKIAQFAAFNANLPADMAESDRAQVLALQEYRDYQQQVADNEDVLPAQRAQAREEVKNADEIISEIVAGKTATADNVQPAPETTEPSPVVEPTSEPEAPAEVAPSPAPVTEPEAPKLPDVNVQPQEAYPPRISEERIAELPEEGQNFASGAFFSDPAATVGQMTELSAGDDLDATADLQTATGDRVTEAAIEMLERKGHKVDPKEVSKIRDFIIPEMFEKPYVNDQNEHPANALDRLTDEYIVEQGGVPLPLVSAREQAAIQAVESLPVAEIAAAESLMDSMGNDTVRILSAMDGTGTKEDVETYQQFAADNPQAAKAINSLLNEKLEQDAGGTDAGAVTETGAVTGQAQETAGQDAVEEPRGAQGGQTDLGDAAADVPARDTVERAQSLSKETPATPEKAAEVRDMATSLIEESPLPETADESAASQLVANGSVDEATAVAAAVGDEAAQEKIDESLPDLKKDMTDERADAFEAEGYADTAALHSAEETLERPVYVETETEFVVTRSTDVREEMRYLGGKWVPGRGWVFPLSKKESVIAALAKKRSPGPDERQRSTPGLAGRIGAALRNALVLKGFKSRRRRIAKGKSLQERLGIAKEELRIAADERAQRVARTIERLQKAFPGITVVTDTAEVAAAAKAAFPGFEPPVGFVHEGKVYVDLERSGTDVPMHEFGHILNTLMKQHFPAQYQQGIEIIKGSEYEAAVREDARYANLDDDGVWDEALALAIGERGARMMSASRWSRFKSWLNEMAVSLRAFLGGDATTMTAAQWADLQAAKMLSGDEVFPETSAEIARIEKEARAMFVGEGAEVSARAKSDLDAAREMERRGVSNIDIWRATNWRRGVDGKWKFEVSDRDAVLTVEPSLMQNGDVMLLKNVMLHDALFEMYPEMGNMAVLFINDPSAQYQAALATDSEGSFIVVNLAKSGNVRSSLLHEMQHVVQLKEGFAYAPGHTPEDSENLRQINALAVEIREMPDGKEKNDAVARLSVMVEKHRDKFHRTAGEVEARNVQLRAETWSETAATVFPETTEDVAAEEQTVFFANESAMSESKTPGFEEEGGVLEGTTPYARAHFGSTELRAAAVRAAAQQIIEIEISDGTADKDTAVAQIAAELGIDTVLVEQLWQEAETRLGQKVNFFDLREGKLRKGIDAFAKKLQRGARRQFSYKGLLPKDVFHDAQRMTQSVQAVLYRAEKQAKDLDRAIKAYVKSQEPRMSKKAQQDFRQHVNDVLSGRAEWDGLPTDVAAAARAMRATLDDLSRKLLLSGAFNKNAIVTVMENMGVVIDNTVDAPQFYVAVEALSKPPYERTDEENLLVDAFLEQHQKTFGTYLTRSYRVHNYPDWKERVPQDVWNRARRFFINELVAERDRLEAIVSRRDDRDAKKIQDLKEERGKVVNLVNKITDEFDEKVEQMTAAKETSGVVSEGAALDLEAVENAVEAAKDFIGKVREEMSRLVNLSNADVASLDGMIGENATALMGYLHHYRALNDEILALEAKMEHDRAKAAEDLDEVNNRLAHIDDYMGEILGEQSKTTDTLMTGGTLGSKNLGITKKRKDIPEEIRALYGEYKDPVINFTQSVMKMANLLESQNFLNRMRSRYEGVYFFRPGKQPSGAWEKISAEGNPRMAPLDGWYTTPDIAQAMQDHYSSESVAQWQKLWAMYVVNAVKLGKTILSPVTQMRNFWGNTSFMVANGWNPYRMFQAWQEYGAMWNGMDSAKWRKYAERLHELGVFGESVNAKDIENLRNTLGFENAPKEDYGQFVEERVMGMGKRFARAPKATFEVAKRLYEMGDSFYKMMGFENEKRRYARAWFSKPFDELTPQQQAEVEERAAHIVKSVLPTYSYVPRIVKTIRRLPFVGTFVAFPAEMVRVTYNAYSLAAQEMKDPRTRVFGMMRLAGISTAITASAALVEIFKGLAGYDDEEWDDANKFVADYQKNAMLLPLPRDKAGNMRYINLSYTDPFSFLAKTVNAGFDDPTKPPAGRAADMLKTLTEPFLSPELSFWTFMQIAMNVDDRSRPIRETAYEDGIFGSNFLAEENLRRQFDFARKKLQPGLVKSVWDAYDTATVNADKSGKVKEWSDFALSHAFGLNVERIDPKVSYGFQMDALMMQRNRARAGYTAVQNQLDRQWKSLQPKLEEMSPSDRAERERRFAKEARDRMTDQYEVSKSAYFRILKDAHESTQALLRLGISPAEARAELKEKRWGTKNGEIDAIVSGNFDDMILTFKKKGDYPVAPKE